MSFLHHAGHMLIYDPSRPYIMAVGAGMGNTQVTQAIHMLPSHVGRFQGINAANVICNLALEALMSPTNYHLPSQIPILKAVVPSSSSFSFIHNKGIKPTG